ncbi:hypothetical protein [Actinoallomurus acaciae]|uniref:Secreted protein n=1 Tax=Actinoallomurus acaciae TaxID=502577 RepID=A0ABV5YER9_9ACTN
MRRSLPVLRLAWGGLLVTAPRAVLHVLSGRAATASQVPVMRVLGARHVVQAAVELARPTPRALRAGAAVDPLHASTCAVAVSPIWRRPALVDGTGALTLATAGLMQASRARP